MHRVFVGGGSDGGVGGGRGGRGRRRRRGVPARGAKCLLGGGAAVWSCAGEGGSQFLLGDGGYQRVLIVYHDRKKKGGGQHRAKMGRRGKEGRVICSQHAAPCQTSVAHVGSVETLNARGGRGG
jgi:hypothetical protein